MVGFIFHQIDVTTDRSSHTDIDDHRSGHGGHGDEDQGKVSENLFDNAERKKRIAKLMSKIRTLAASSDRKPLSNLDRDAIEREKSWIQKVLREQNERKKKNLARQNTKGNAAEDGAKTSKGFLAALIGGNNNEQDQQKNAKHSPNLAILEEFGPFSTVGGRFGPVVENSDETLSFDTFRITKGLPEVRPPMPSGGRQRLGEDFLPDGTFADKEYNRKIVFEDETDESEKGKSNISVSSPTLDLSTIFISVASYRDVFCQNTIKSIFDNARVPERVFVGIIRQQDDTDQFNCISSEHRFATPALSVAASSTAATPSMRSMQLYCATSAFCPTDNIRIRFQLPTEAKGPTHGRYVSMLMYHGEQFAMIIDSHTAFAPKWDIIMISDAWNVMESYEPKDPSLAGGSEGEERRGTTIPYRTQKRRNPRGGRRITTAPPKVVRNTDENDKRALRLAGNGKGVVLSHYPPALQSFNIPFPFEQVRSLTVMCSAHYLDSAQTYGLIRMDGTNLGQRLRGGEVAGGEKRSASFEPIPRLQPFTAAGFLFGDAAFLLDVPFDPYLDFMFDGEEILYSVRLWTHGYDSYAPSKAVVAHIYGRSQAPRVWSVPNNLWWKHQELAHRRFHYIMETYKKLTTVAPSAGVTLSSDPAALTLTADSSLPPPERIMALEGLLQAKKADEIIRYGCGNARNLSDFYTFANVDRVRWHIKPTHCTAM